MEQSNSNHLNLFDYFGFPDRQLREDAKGDFDLEKLRLITVKNPNLCMFNSLLEQYKPWSLHINNFCSSLGVHLLLMHFQYKQNPLDTKDVEKFESPENAHKLFFDTFVEDVTVYLISYFDKQLEMFNDIYSLNYLAGKKRLKRRQIIEEMSKVAEIQKLADAYSEVEQSIEFEIVNGIRNNFVHNKAETYYGINVQKTIIKGIGTTYTTYKSTGISTEKTYQTICVLINKYAQVCAMTNDFFNKQMEDVTKENN